MEIAEAAVKEQLEIMKEQSKKGEKFVNEKVRFQHGVECFCILDSHRCIN